jgi:hypothetical protein
MGNVDRSEDTRKPAAEDTEDDPGIAIVEARIRAADPHALATELVELYDECSNFLEGFDGEAVARFHRRVRDVVYGQREPAPPPDIDDLVEAERARMQAFVEERPVSSLEEALSLLGEPAFYELVSGVKKIVASSVESAVRDALVSRSATEGGDDEIPF